MSLHYRNYGVDLTLQSGEKCDCQDKIMLSPKEICMQFITEDTVPIKLKEMYFIQTATH